MARHHAVVGDLQHELAVAVPIFHDVPCLRKQVRRSASGDGRGRAAGCAHVQDAPRTASPPRSKRYPSPPRAPCGQPGRTSAQRGSMGRRKLVVTRQAAVRRLRGVTEGSHRELGLRRKTTASYYPLKRATRALYNDGIGDARLTRIAAVCVPGSRSRPWNSPRNPFLNAL